MSKSSDDKVRSRRRFQWSLGALAALPFATATREIILGPQGLPGGSPEVTPTVDSALRYASVFKLTVAPVMWTQLLKEDEPSIALESALGSIFAGGLVRVRS